jgi:hypothetical protein
MALPIGDSMAVVLLGGTASASTPSVVSELNRVMNFYADQYVAGRKDRGD